MSALTVEEIGLCLHVRRSVAERIASRMPAPMNQDEFVEWIESFKGANVLTSTPPPFPQPNPETMFSRSAMEGRRGLVYFAEAVGCNRIKIGFTAKASPAKRVKDLQTSCPFPIEILGSFPGSMATEVGLHERFASLRVMPTTEWFHGARDLRDLIDLVAVKS